MVQWWGVLVSLSLGNPFYSEMEAGVLGKSCDDVCSSHPLILTNIYQDYKTNYCSMEVWFNGHVELE